MKRIAKIMTVALLVIVAAISVSAAKVELTLTDAGTQGDYTSGVYYLDVVATNDSDEYYINVVDMKFTFNTEKIELFCLDDEYGAFPLNEEIDSEWYAYAETALVLGTNGKTGLQKATFSKAYVNATVDGNNCTAQFTANAPTGKVTKFPTENFKVYQIGLYIPGDVTALTAEDFKIEHMYVGTWDGVESGETNNYGFGNWTGSVAGQIDVTNNVVPEAEDITIPVTEGDVIYFVDGTKAVAEATGDYVVPANVGYIAVNTGKTAQAVYYVDGTTATKVHENAVLGTNEVSLKPHTMIDGKDKNGLRFKLLHNSITRSGDNAVEEVGFIMTVESQKVLNAIGADYELTMDLVPTYARTGMAYGKNENGALVNKATSTVNETAFEIHGVMWNIPLTKVNVTTNIVSRPYFKVGGQYIYGEVTKATLYDTAKAIKESSSFETLDQAKKDYIIEIIALVDGYTEIVKDEVIIDVGSLYE